MRIHRTGEHALELEPLDVGVQALEVGLDAADRGEVLLGGGEIQQFRGVAEAALEPVDAADDFFQAGPFAAEFLRPPGVVPDAGFG